MSLNRVLHIFLIAYLACTALTHDFDDTIAVVGAGYSGLSAAFTLVKKGYTNVEIYESQGEVGGYVYSVDYNNVAHDLATYALTPAYWKFQEAMKSIGVGFCELDVAIVQTNSTPVSVPFEKWMAAYWAAKVPNPLNLVRKVSTQVSTYVEVWKKLFNMDFIDTSTKRTNRLFPLKTNDVDVLAQFSMPMKDFVALHKLDLLEPLFIQATDSQAYGPYDTTPALYYMVWFPPNLFNGEENTVPCGTYNSMQSMAEHMAEWLKSKGVTFHMNTKVTKISRATDGSSPSLLEEGVATPKLFDTIISTNKLPSANRAEVVTPLLPKEREAADTYEELQMFSALLETNRSDAIPTTGFLMVDADAIIAHDPNTGFWGCLNAERRGGYSDENAILSSDTVTRVSAIYYYTERANNERIDFSLDEKIQQVKTNLATWDSATWTNLTSRTFGGYFQRWRTPDVMGQKPWNLADIQGEGDVYYVNSAACGFESVGHVFDCADNLIKDFF
uniref:Polyenoic fatty acid isomerase n=1 Tax=Ptilota filicina TaxID=153248 RepID=PFI_PTIFI|nr:RecName: Full=Polyenoic fatty acid isomerase; Short=PFI; Flags: Precursor [Ptilota filicina]AAL57199.1 polyenoic fatty acid isomerase [Ptilota filicina]